MRRRGERRFRPEVQLLLSCAREQTLDDPGGPDAVSPPDDLDWDTVVYLARRHRLQPFVHRSLVGGDVSVPARVQTALEETSEALARRNLYLSSELSDLVDRLEAGGVRVLTYKGPSLAALAYRDVTLRRFVDLDLLVPEGDFEEATEILRAGNYAVEDSFPAFGETTLRERDTGLAVDLHFRLTPTRYPFAFSFDQLWERRIEASPCGTPVPTLDPPDLLPVLAVHGTRHFWVQLEWVVSFAALARRESIQWADVLRRSRQIGCDRMVLLGLRLSRELLGLSLPEGASARVDADRIVRLAARRVVSRVVCQDVDHSQGNRQFHYERYLTQLTLMRGLRDRGKYARRIGTSLVTNRIRS